MPSLLLASSLSTITLSSSKKDTDPRTWLSHTLPVSRARSDSFTDWINYRTAQLLHISRTCSSRRAGLWPDCRMDRHIQRRVHGGPSHQPETNALCRCQLCWFCNRRCRLFILCRQIFPQEDNSICCYNPHRWSCSLRGFHQQWHVHGWPYHQRTGYWRASRSYPHVPG